MEKQDRSRRLCLAAGFSLPLALCLVLGHQLEKTDHLSPGLSAAAAFILLAAALTALTTWSFRLRFPAVRGTDKTADKSPRRHFLLTWLAIAVPNFIVLLGVYPGFFVYDAQDELMEVVTRTFSTHHPLFHVLALGGVIAAVHKLTASWNAGIFTWLLLQMLFITAVHAFVLERLRHAALRRPLRILFMIWYAFFPTIVMYTLCSTKDGLFSAFASLFVLTLAEMNACPYAAAPDNETARTPRFPIDRQRVLLICSAAMMMLLRNNASYVMIAFAALLALSLLRKPRNKMRIKIISVVIISFAIYFVINHLLIFATNAETGEHQESISVAIQSLGRAYAYHPESFSEEEQAVLLSYLSEEGLRSYELRNVDLLKATFNNAHYEKDRLSFWRLWAETGLRHPGTYLTSWLLTSYGLWYPFTVQNVYRGHTVFTFTYTESSYFGYETELPGVRASLIPPLDALYRWLSLDATIQRIPVLSLPFSPAFWFWFYVWFAARELYQKRGSALLPLVPLFLLWLTYLIGPYALVRYALPFFTALPVLALLSRNAQNDARA